MRTTTWSICRSWVSAMARHHSKLYGGRMKRFDWLCALAGCGGDGGGALDGAAADLALIACGLIQGVAAPARAVPGQAAAVAVVDGGSGRDYQVSWSAPSGAFAPATGKQ